MLSWLWVEDERWNQQVAEALTKGSSEAGRQLIVVVEGFGLRGFCISFGPFGMRAAPPFEP
jgi:hypothetical protein